MARKVIMIAAGVALLAAGFAAGRILAFDFPSHEETQGTTIELADALVETLRDCPDCPELVRIPGQSFAVGRYEVTFAEWDACVDAGGCKGYRPDDHGWGRANRPVIEVSWHDTQAYLQWLSQRTGVHYRLLTSAEWLLAVRARATTSYSWGDQDPVCDQSVLNGINFSLCVDDRTRAVGSFQPNRYGLFDMHGNVHEWVEDCRAPGLFEELFVRNHSCGDDAYRVRRGGSWQDDPVYQRATHETPMFLHPDFRYKDTGFRVARTI